ncbi:MAG: hypothetical protein WC470_01070 [Candidatus Paceibacterota bacterium]
MIAQIAYTLILGKPLIFYAGIITFLSFCFTALIGYLNFNNKHAIPFPWHPLMAKISIFLALVHGILGLAIYLNF